MPYLSTHLRHGMHTSRLPLEICEHVIDSACYEDPDEDWLHGTSYRTWCQTAIVCYYWLPRSQLNLFRDIQIRSASRLDLLLRTLSDTPHLADLVYGVRIAPLKSEYIAFARLLIPQLLKHCMRVQLIGAAWEAFPPRYATDRILYQWRNRGLTHFAITLEQGCCASVLRFLYTLPRLQKLTLSASRETIHIPENVLAILHGQPCPFTNLEKTCIMGCVALFQYYKKELIHALLGFGCNHDISAAPISRLYHTSDVVCGKQYLATEGTLFSPTYTEEDLEKTALKIAAPPLPPNVIRIQSHTCTLTMATFSYPMYNDSECARRFELKANRSGRSKL